MLLTNPVRNLIKNKPAFSRLCPTSFIRKLNYIQGQSPKPNTREYFYYIDHQVRFIPQPTSKFFPANSTNFDFVFPQCEFQLFLDDAKIKNFTSCFKEKKFLIFFFKRLQVNSTGRYENEFPYYSPCGRESNYVRCDDVPVVFTHVVPDPVNESEFRFCYGHAGDELNVKFEPEKVVMLPNTGRVYHPAPNKTGGIGLVKSSLAIEFSKYFKFGHSEEKPPTHFTWNGKTYDLIKWYDPSLLNKVMPHA